MHGKAANASCSRAGSIRMRLPLLSDGEELLAAGDGILSARMAGWLRARCANLRWTCLA